MLDQKQIFKNKKPVAEKLLQFGFMKQGASYNYSVEILDGAFLLIITMAEEVTTKVIDCDSGEEYALVKVAAASGAFVGAVSNACEMQLRHIAQCCFELEVFKSPQAKQVIAYMKSKYGTEAEFLWAKSPRNAVFRRDDNKKWYAALLSVQREKLGLPGDGMIEIIDLRIPMAQLETLIDGRRYLPGYHMNKQHWVTICLDEMVDIGEIEARIDHSFALAENEVRRKKNDT